MVNSLHTPLNRETIISREQSSGAPLPLRVELNQHLQAIHNKMCMAIIANNGDMWSRAWESLKDCCEQITLLNAIDEGYIKPVFGQE